MKVGSNTKQLVNFSPKLTPQLNKPKQSIAKKVNPEKFHKKFHITNQLQIKSLKNYFKNPPQKDAKIFCTFENLI